MSSKLPLELKPFTIRELPSLEGYFRSLDDRYGFVPKNLSLLHRIQYSNPAASPDDLSLILLVRDNQALGRLDFYTGTACCGGQEFKTHWMASFHLEQQARKTGAGAGMILEASRRCRSLLAAGAPSDGAERLYIAAGLKKLPALHRYLFFLKVDPVVKWYLKREIPAKLLSLCLAPPLDLRNSIILRKKRSRIDFKRIARFNDSIDQLRPDAENYFPKSSRVLNWLLSHKKLMAFEAYLENQVVGYVILRCDDRRAGGELQLPAMRIGVVVDWLLPDLPGRVNDLLSFVIPIFASEGVDVVQFHVQDGEDAAICKKFGMIRKGGARGFFKPENKSSLNASGSWYLTEGIGDMLLYGPAYDHATGGEA